METPAGRPRYPQHFDGKRFYNPGAQKPRGLVDVLRWKLSARPAPSPAFVADVEPSAPPVRVPGTSLRVTLVNHSTVLLQHRGRNILTDPIWSDRASPVSWAGPRRHRIPGISWENLPPTDTVLLSHDHYDHLDLPTLRRLSNRGASTFVVPSGVARLLRSENIGPVHELDWGDSLPLPELLVHSVPAVHFSGRSLHGRDRTLWCGYVLEFPERTVYFAGDTAFSPHFAQVREDFGPPHLALLPVGAYEPRWFMSPVHMDPGEAVRAHQILGARTSIAIHHGTFQLADEALDAPKQRLAGLDSIQVLDNGRFVEIA
jgi:L-ascorbate metabolism protein UlaG (beta-lactamase superfamily)